MDEIVQFLEMYLQLLCLWPANVQDGPAVARWKTPYPMKFRKTIKSLKNGLKEGQIKVD